MSPGYFEKHPLVTFVVIVLCAFLAEYLWPERSLATIAVAVGAAGFANSLWLNARLNRMQDALVWKGVVDNWEFIVDERLREIASAHRPKSMLETFDDIIAKRDREKNNE